MATIVFESEKKVREVLTSLLVAAGRKKILATGHPGQFGHWLKEEDSNTHLIVIGAHPGDDVQLSLIKMVENSRGLDGVPVVYLSDARHSFAGLRRRRTPNMSRIDEFLRRPFGLNSLKKAITRAQETRAMSRDVIIHFGEEPSEALSQALYEYEMQFHWQEIVSVRTPEEFSRRVDQLGWRVGALFVSPTTQSMQVAELLRWLRNTRFGAQTPFVVLSQAPDQVVRFRNICDLFLPIFDETLPHNWLDVLNLTSGRLLQNGATRELQMQVRADIRKGRLGSAAVLIAEGLRLDPNRYELIEQAGTLQEKRGRYVEAVALYKKALGLNPCAPYSHLRLLDLLSEGDEKRRMVEHSARFCPRHPQVQNQISPNSPPEAHRSLEFAQ